MVHCQDNKRSLIKRLSCSHKVGGLSEHHPKDICASTAPWLPYAGDTDDLFVEGFEKGRQDEGVLPRDTCGLWRGLSGSLTLKGRSEEERGGASKRAAKSTAVHSPSRHTRWVPLTRIPPYNQPSLPATIHQGHHLKSNASVSLPLFGSSISKGEVVWQHNMVPADCCLHSVCLNNTLLGSTLIYY